VIPKKEKQERTYYSKVSENWMQTLFELKTPPFLISALDGNV
jgi:hypothetical protein